MEQICSLGSWVMLWPVSNALTDTVFLLVLNVSEAAGLSLMRLKADLLLDNLSDFVCAA